jgi:glutamate-1-semialdehyde 2,1-aminomutase
MDFKKSEKLYEEGLVNLVGAVNSPVRAFNSVGGNPLFIKKAKDSTIVDVDGNKYVDYVVSYGPMVIGHRHKKVLKAVRKSLKNGFSFGASTKGEIKLAKLICDAFPTMDKVRFVNSGTEAVFSALRLARAYTGKSKIIKFSGCYHGHADALLVAAGSGLATLSMPGSNGVPKEAVKNTLIAKFNDLDSVKAQFEKHKDIAAIILEPIAGNMGVVVPDGEFLKGIQQLAKEHNALIIADEVMTGFRSKFGGAQELLGLEADITCLGKVIGGGFPVGAYGARNEIMNKVAPLGDMYQAGTLSGNPVAMAAGYATLKELHKQSPYEKFENIADLLKTIIFESAKKYGVSVQVNSFGSMINPFFYRW